MVLPSNNSRAFAVFANVCRWVLSLVLMLSGFLKATDPVGGVYKLQEYVAAFSLSGISDDWLLVFSVVQAAAEFLLGICLFVGIYRGAVTFMALIVMLLFTPLSLYVWVSGVVTDCGCFGESVTMSNGATFAKNVLLLLFAVVAFWGRSLFICRMSRKTRWVFVLFSLAYIFSMQLFAVMHLPLLDSGPYAVGGNIRSKVEYVPDEYEYKAVYYNKETGNGEPFVVDSDTVMGGEWELDGYTEVLVAPGTEPEISNFSILDWDRDIEFADELLADAGYVCIVAIDDVRMASVTHVDRINDLYDYCRANGIRFYATSSSYGDDVLLWRKRTGAEYPLYWSEQVMLRSMLHANPGLLLLKDGVVVGKWAAADIPAIDECDASLLLADAVESRNAGVPPLYLWVAVLLGWAGALLLIDASLVGIGRRRRKRAMRIAAQEQALEEKTSDTI